MAEAGGPLLGRWIYGNDRIVEGYSDYARIIKSDGAKYVGKVD